MANIQRPTKVPGFSGVLPKNTDPALVQRINELTEALDIRLGRRGDPKDRAITLRELVESGLASELAATPFNPNNPTRGNIGLRPPGVSDQTIPPAPTGVTATGGYSLITVFWDFPTYTNHSQTEIWRFDTNTIGDAILVGTSGGRSFVDPVGESATYYYWVRHVSESGIPGPFHATLGASASTAADVTELLTTLNGAISASQLTAGLLAMIDGAGSAIDLAALQTFVGYDSGYTGDPLLTLIEVNEDLLTAVKDYTGYVSGYSGSTLLARIITSEGSITTINADITALETTVNHASTGVAATSTALGLLTTRVTTAEGTIVTQSSAITALETTVNHGTTGVAATAAALATLTTTVTTQGGTITSQGSAITTLQNTVNHGTTGVAATAAAVSALGTRVTTAEGNITTNAADITALETTVNHGTTGVAATASALSTLTTTVNVTQAGQISVLSGQYTSLSTTVGGHTTTISSHTTSINGLSAEYMVKINANGRVSGFGLYGDETGSEFIILADRFAIVSHHSDAVTATPFIVQTTTTTIGGVSVPAGIYISDAFIMNGTIVNAKIANAAIDDAKIASLSANKITTGTLDTSRLNIDGATLIAEDGVLKIGFLDVDNLTAGIITTDKIIGAAINSVATSDVTTANALPTTAAYEVVNDLEFIKDLEGESHLTVKFQIEAVATGSGNYALYARIKKDGVVVSRVFSYFMTRSFNETVQGEVVLIGYGAGTSTYELDVQANISGAGITTATVNSSTLTVTEVKR